MAAIERTLVSLLSQSSQVEEKRSTAQDVASPHSGSRSESAPATLLATPGANKGNLASEAAERDLDRHIKLSEIARVAGKQSSYRGLRSARSPSVSSSLLSTLQSVTLASSTVDESQAATSAGQEDRGTDVICFFRGYRRRTRVHVLQRAICLVRRRFLVFPLSLTVHQMLARHDKVTKQHASSRFARRRRHLRPLPAAARSISTHLYSPQAHSFGTPNNEFNPTRRCCAAAAGALQRQKVRCTLFQLRTVADRTQ